MKSIIRSKKRKHGQLRDVKISFNVFGYSAGSVLFEIGNTKVLCSVNLQQGVPPFLKGKKVGWLNAEYAMLPSATVSRTVRESSVMRRNGRSVEISRLIGRSLRSIIDFSSLGERTIVVDCDVLQADGGTRTACTTAACLALRVAENKWLKNNVIASNILKDSIAAVSVGIVNDSVLLDVDFSEDSSVDADFNFILTKSQKIVEIQGAVEGAAVSWEQFEQARLVAIKGVGQLFAITDNYFEQMVANLCVKKQEKKKNVPLFSLQNRKNVSV